MSFAFSEEQQQLQRGARRFFAEVSASPAVRAAMQTDAGYDPALWKRLSAQMGYTAILVPAEHGGLGLGQVELAAVMEEMGRQLVCAPFLSSACLAANALSIAGSEAQKQALLPALAAGDQTFALAYLEAGGQPALEHIQTVYRRDEHGYALRGEKSYVVDGHTADVLIVAARAEGSQGSRGVSLFVVPASAAGLTRMRLHTMDQTRRLAAVRLDGVRVPEPALLGAPGAGRAYLAAILDLGAIALGAEQLGGAQACLDMAVGYAKVREQFGRPIGSFQAIKHKCADMMVLVESARSAVYYAAWAADAARAAGSAAGAPGEAAELAMLAPAVKAYCSDAYVSCAAENIQIHGGVGFTWEHDAHLYFKRARSSQLLLGDPVYQREELARRLDL